MKILKVLINVCALISIINAHAQLSVPKPRFSSTQQVSGDGFNQYYFKGVNRV